MALALHNYDSAYGALPPAAVTDKNGKALLSWRVLILPYIEHDDVFRQFHLDEPWDSPHNIQLLEKMPRTYAPFSGKKTEQPYTTYYQVFVGKDTPFETGRVNSLQDFPKGTNNTFLIVEGGNAVPWTKPDDLEFDANAPLPRLGGVWDDRMQVAMGDGSIQWFYKPLNESEIRGRIGMR
jgi:uncharacterized protein DUF1559